MNYVIAYGNAFDGLWLVGPFGSQAEAEEAVEENMGDWVIVELYDPDED